VLAKISIITGFSSEPGDRIVEKAPPVPGRVGMPFTLTVAPGEALPETVMDSDHARGSSAGWDISRPALGAVKIGGGPLSGAMVGAVVASGVMVGCGLGLGTEVGCVLGVADGDGGAEVTVERPLELGTPAVASSPHAVTVNNARAANSTGRVAHRQKEFRRFSGKYPDWILPQDPMNNGTLNPASQPRRTGRS